MEKDLERRRSARMSVSSLISCCVKNGEQQYKGGLRDMSVTGIFMESREPVALCGGCEIMIILNGEHSRLIIDGLKGSVIRSDEGGVAIRLESRMEWFPLISSYFLCPLSRS
jgi:hypothetical protein